jgi:hypothetical protein
MPHTKSKQKKISRRGAAIPLGSARVPFTPGNAPMSINCEVFLGKLTTTVTSGVIASTTPIQAGIIASFGSRFALFDEYLLESFTVKLDTCSSNLAGLINVWFETNATSTATPTQNDAKDNKTLTFAAGSNDRTHKLHYNPRNAVTQVWTPISTTTVTIGNLKVYTDNSNYGSSVVATDYVVMTGVMRVSFRGFG